MSASGGGVAVRLVRGVASLVVLALVLAGTPWLLWRVGRLDVARHLGWSQLVQPGDTGQLLLLVLTVLGWASWLFVIATVLSELVFVISRERIDLPVPGSGWLRPVVGVLVVAVVGLVLASAHGSAGSGGSVDTPVGTGRATATSTASGAQAPTAPATHTPDSRARPGSTTDASNGATGHAGTSARPRAGSSSDGSAPQGTHGASSRRASSGDGAGVPTSRDAVVHAQKPAHYIVQPHDDLWDLAQKLYDDPTRWRDIASANHLDADATIVPGQALLIPHLGQHDLTNRTGQPAPDTRPRTVVVQRGDTLTSLARQHLGSASYWQALQLANETLVTHPDALQVGWTLHLPPRLPSSSPSGTSTHSSASTHTSPSARRGDAVPRSTGTSGGAPTTSTTPSSSATASTAGSPRPSTERSGHSSANRASTPRPAATTGASGLPTAMPTPAPGPADTRHGTRQSEHVAASVPTVQQAGDDAVDRAQLAAILAGIGALSASGIAWGLRRRRREREFSRPLGRRAPVIEDADHLDFDAALRRADALAPARAADLEQTAVVLGENPRRSVVVDLTDAGQLVVRGADDLVSACGSAIVVALASAPWSDGLPVRVAGSVLHWVHELDNPLVRVSGSVDDLLADLRRITTRRASTSSAATSERPEEPAPEVWVVDARELADAEQEGLVGETGRRAATVGVHVVWLLGGRELLASEHELVTAGECDALTLHDHQVAELTGEPDGFVPTLVSEPARRVLVELFDVSSTTRAEQAPWWVTSPSAPAPVLDGAHLAGAPGVEPRDAVEACEPLVDELPVDEFPVDELPVEEPIPATLQKAWHPVPLVAPAAASCAVQPAPASLVGMIAQPVPSIHPSTGRLELSRRPDTEHPEAAMARIPDVLAHPEHPTLLLLGPVELAGARGEPPTRATRQCLEYCAWLMQHPGQTSQAMARSLLVAEGTRRSNMSRLRSWLGTAPDGSEYLPDAYSGRIHLHPGVTSDWEHLQLLTSAGINRASDDALVEALELVRGAPLADAAPGQWHWAEELRTEMTQTLRDIAVLLADRAIAAQDADLARWACCRALTVAPDDELLLCARIRAEQLAGHRGEVERLVLQLTRTARMLGVDLAEETVVLMQEVMEGRVRGRAALS